MPTLLEDNSAYSNHTYGASPSAPQITEVPVYDSGSTRSIYGKQTSTPQDNTKVDEPKKQIFNIPFRPAIL